MTNLLIGIWIGLVAAMVREVVAAPVQPKPPVEAVGTFAVSCAADSFYGRTYKCFRIDTRTGVVEPVGPRE